MIVTLFLLASAHNQNFGNTACVGQNGTIDVGTAKLSNSFHVEDSLCTFTVHASHVDAVSVSRLAPGTGGYVDVGAHREHELPAEASGEPFAIVPLYNTVSLPRTAVPANGKIQVYVPGRALVSFGTREDYRLVFGKVVVDAYETRDFVYGMPTLPMYLIHLLCLLLVATKCMSAVFWLAVSAVLDCLIWTIWVWTYTWGGSFFLVIFAARLLFLAYLYYMPASTIPFSDIIFTGYVLGILAWSDVAYSWVYALVLLVASCWINWYPALLLCVGILLNMGAGVLGFALYLMRAQWREWLNLILIVFVLANILS